MIENKTGVAVPLSALRTEDSPVVGEFSSLIPFADFSKNAGLSVIQLLPGLAPIRRCADPVAVNEADKVDLFQFQERMAAMQQAAPASKRMFA